MAKAFGKVSERNALKPRRDPYWERMQKGCYLGYRKMAKGADGTWLARALLETTGKQAHKPLSDFGALPDHLRYDRAKKEAQKWFEHLGRGGNPDAVTLRSACERYVEHQRENKGDKAANDAEGRFTRWVYAEEKLCQVELGKLTITQIRDWRKKLKSTPVSIGAKKKLVKRIRADGTLNRDMTCLRAALNLAHANGLATSDHAWRAPLQPIKNADKPRDVYLDLKERRKLIKHSQKDVANLLRGLSLLPLRPGALAVLTVASFDKKLKTLTIGKDKNGADRKITLPDATALFFTEQMKNKLPAAPLISRANGKAWDKDAWKYPIKEAAMAAQLPNNVTAYALRHSVITDLIHGGLDCLTVAQLSGTSIAMIEKHYGHLTKAHAKAALSMLVL